MYSKLKQRYDTRSPRGHRLINRHVKWSVTWPWELDVWFGGWRRGLRDNELFVDWDGILKCYQAPPKKKIDFDWLPAMDSRHHGREEFIRWTDGRKLGRRGSVWFWFDPIRSYDVERQRWTVIAWRQGRVAAQDEIDRFQTFMKHFFGEARLHYWWENGLQRTVLWEDFEMIFDE